jgi:hypothetical protein
MAEIVLALTTCWKLVTAITTIVDRFEQTRGDGQAFKVIYRSYDREEAFFKQIRSIFELKQRYSWI